MTSWVERNSCKRSHVSSLINVLVICSVFVFALHIEFVLKGSDVSRSLHLGRNIPIKLFIMSKILIYQI